MMSNNIEMCVTFKSISAFVKDKVPSKSLKKGGGEASDFEKKLKLFVEKNQISNNHRRHLVKCPAALFIVKRGLRLN